MGEKSSVGRRSCKERYTTVCIRKTWSLNPEEFEELHQIMLRASEQEEHFVPLDWEEIDCPEVWGENGETITYDWFDNEGPTMDAAVEYYNAKVVVP